MHAADAAQPSTTTAKRDVLLTADTAMHTHCVRRGYSQSSPVIIVSMQYAAMKVAGLLPCTHKPMGHDERLLRQVNATNDFGFTQQLAFDRRLIEVLVQACASTAASIAKVRCCIDSAYELDFALRYNKFLLSQVPLPPKDPRQPSVFPGAPRNIPAPPLDPWRLPSNAALRQIVKDQFAQIAPIQDECMARLINGSTILRGDHTYSPMTKMFAGGKLDTHCALYTVHNDKGYVIHAVWVKSDSYTHLRECFQQLKCFNLESILGVYVDKCCQRGGYRNGIVDNLGDENIWVKLDLWHAYRRLRKLIDFRSATHKQFWAAFKRAHMKPAPGAPVGKNVEELPDWLRSIPPPAELLRRITDVLTEFATVAGPLVVGPTGEASIDVTACSGATAELARAINNYLPHVRGDCLSDPEGVTIAYKLPNGIIRVSRGTTGSNERLNRDLRMVCNKMSRIGPQLAAGYQRHRAWEWNAKVLALHEASLQGRSAWSAQTALPLLRECHALYRRAITGSNPFGHLLIPEFFPAAVHAQTSERIQKDFRPFNRYVHKDVEDPMSFDIAKFITGVEDPRKLLPAADASMSHDDVAFPCDWRRTKYSCVNVHDAATVIHSLHTALRACSDACAPLYDDGTLTTEKLKTMIEQHVIRYAASYGLDPLRRPEQLARVLLLLASPPGRWDTTSPQWWSTLLIIVRAVGFLVGRHPLLLTERSVRVVECAVELSAQPSLTARTPALVIVGDKVVWASFRFDAADAAESTPTAVAQTATSAPGHDELSERSDSYDDDEDYGSVTDLEDSSQLSDSTDQVDVEGEESSDAGSDNPPESQAQPFRFSNDDDADALTNVQRAPRRSVRRLSDVEFLRQTGGHHNAQPMMAAVSRQTANRALDRLLVVAIAKCFSQPEYAERPTLIWSKVTGILRTLISAELGDGVSIPQNLCQRLQRLITQRNSMRKEARSQDEGWLAYDAMVRRARAAHRAKLQHTKNRANLSLRKAQQAVDMFAGKKQKRGRDPTTAEPSLGRRRRVESETPEAAALEPKPARVVAKKQQRASRIEHAKQRRLQSNKRKAKKAR